jgi:DNA-binding beta-propeller fold protein YncE
MPRSKLNRERRIETKKGASRRFWKLNLLAFAMIFSLFATSAVASAQSHDYVFEEK